MKYTQYEESILKRLQKEELGILKDFVKICDKHNIDYFIMYGTAIGAVRHGGFIPWDDDIDVGMLREDYEKFLEVAPKEFYGRYKIMGPDSEEKYYNLVPNMNKVGTKFNTIYDRGRYDIGILMDIYPLDYISEDEDKKKKQIRGAKFWRDLYLLKNVNFYKLNQPGFVTKTKHMICAFVHYILNIFKVSDEFIYNNYKKYAQKYRGKKTSTVTSFAEFDGNETCMEIKDIFPLKEIKFEDIYVKIPNKYDKMLTNFYGNYMELPPEDKRQNHYPYYLDFGSEENERVCEVEYA